MLEQPEVSSSAVPLGSDSMESLSPAALLGREDSIQPLGRQAPVPEPSGGRPVPLAEAPEPWWKPELEWDRLEPRGLYGKYVRTGFLYVVGALFALPAACLMLPILLINAVAHGGLRRAFYTQERVGLRGRVYTILKFRTMIEAERLSDAERVTVLGRFLRNTHLDELPQFVNVLRGEMCIIGPRPEMVCMERWANEHLPAFGERLVLRPGITGLAQITQGYTSQGDDAACRTKIGINQVYLAQLGLRSDLMILARTVIWMLRRRGWRAPVAANDGAAIQPIANP